MEEGGWTTTSRIVAAAPRPPSGLTGDYLNVRGNLPGGKAESIRGAAIAIALLVSLPAVGSLASPSPSDTAGQPTLPVDLPDGDLLLLLAPVLGLDVERPAIPDLPAGVTLPGIVLHLARRSGQDLAPEDLAPFAEVDPRVALPVAQLLLAVDRSWTLRDAAFAGSTIDAQRAAVAAHDSGAPAANVVADPEALVAAAVLLLDTAEMIVLPQLQAAIDAGAWPDQLVADPAGVLRLGTMGDDVETLDRIVQIDPRGNDAYHNNAGGTTIGNDIDPRTMDTAIALSIDLAGDDTYRKPDGLPAVGAGVIGIGVALDLAGNDVYRQGHRSIGASSHGIGLLRDHDGADMYTGFGAGVGSGFRGIGVLREDAGDDRYFVSPVSGGAGDKAEGFGLLWERGGTDRFDVESTSLWSYGFSADDGHGWFVDELDGVDYYATGDPSRFSNSALMHGCNSCVWTAGVGTPSNGVGQDSSGGLGELLSSSGLWP